MKEIKINKKKIGQDNPPFIIAEMSGNHNHSLARALKIVRAAARAGVQAIKLQTYTPETMTLDVNKNEFLIKDNKSLWRGKSLYELYREAAIPWKWHKPIFDLCHKLGLMAFSTPFDETAIEFLEKLNVPCYKIASFELVDLPLIEKVAATGKPLIISTGMATLKEINEAVNAAQKAGCRQIILLKCTSSYPANPDNSNLATIPDLIERFDCPVGLSDHTLGIGAAIASVVLGATIIEKHFTLSRRDGGVDAAFSIEPEEMRQLVLETEAAWRSLGKINYGPTEQEKRSLIYRRSLYVIKDLKKGEIFSKDNIKAIRPGLGLAPKYLSEIIGQKASYNIKKGTAIRRSMFE